MKRKIEITFETEESISIRHLSKGAQEETQSSKSDETAITASAAHFPDFIIRQLHRLIENSEIRFISADTIRICFNIQLLKKEKDNEDKIK